MANIRIGLIGCGLRLRGVVNRLRENLACDIVAVCDPNPDCVAFVRDTCNQQVAVSETPEALVAADLDWVMIGSPNACHAAHAIAAFQAGKHVFCEKPLATTFEDTLAMQRAWESSGCRFVIGFTLRYSPHYMKLHEYLRADAIGQIISFEFNETLGFNHGGHIHSHPWRRKTADGGSHLLEKCCHDVDLACWLVDALPEKVASFGGRDFFVPANAHLLTDLAPAADGRQPFVCWPALAERVNPFTGDSDVVDNQVGILQFSNGVRATFHTNCASAIPERRLYICGTTGTIRADVLAGTLECQRLGFDTERQDLASGSSGGHGGGDGILSRYLAETMTADREPHTNLRDGVISAVTCFAMNEAMATGAVVDLTPYWQRAGLV
jgi:predicted dehydrogenase